MANINQVLDRYRSIIQRREQLTKAYQEQTSKLDEAETQIRMALLNHLDTHGIDSINARNGKVVPYESEKLQVTNMADFLDFVRKGNQLHLLQRRPVQREVINLLHAGAEVPGVEITRERKLRITLAKTEK